MTVTPDERKHLLALEEAKQWAERAEVACATFREALVLAQEAWNTGDKERARALERVRALEHVAHMLYEALTELEDWQNGPPLVVYTEGWEEAMRMTRAACTAYEQLANLPKSHGEE